MTLCLVLHDLPEGGAEAMEASIWELSESHCMVKGAMLVDTSVSPKYLLSHIRGALSRAGLEGKLLVTHVTTDVHMSGLDRDIEGWIQGSLKANAD
ncbi:hypothetical protein J8J14_04480 [Roseomonas sp. SSH11]|uniref:Thiamine-binding protein domain-containing protein n=1 Tax=Pararoseomonas baculiformis TaxID=2820812 RepID=A0ABS4AAY7_9PROT|nr:hypothetical protein [Pararoseomonas baculiformis]MBP0444026.1 hypothetical protein [Pararoseomonas baculiformis]